MRIMFQEKITKEIIEELEGLRYVDKPNFKEYDYITIKDNGEYLELIMEERHVIKDGEYRKVSKGRATGYKKNNVSGIYQGVEFI